MFNQRLNTDIPLFYQECLALEYDIVKQKKNLRKPSKTLTDQPNTRSFYSTVTLFAKFLGWSTLQPLMIATW
jgi:hypothetical protein